MLKISKVCGQILENFSYFYHVSFLSFLGFLASSMVVGQCTFQNGPGAFDLKDLFQIFNG